MSYFSVQYQYQGEIWNTVVSANSEAEARTIFARLNPHVEQVGGNGEVHGAGSGTGCPAPHSTGEGER